MHFRLMAPQVTGGKYTPHKNARYATRWGKKSVLDGVGSKLNSEDIRKWIRTPKGMKPNTVMKPYSNLPEKDLDDLVAFIMTLR
ncbi:MAG: c-type cytochrome [Acidobacteriota bacterium]